MTERARIVIGADGRNSVVAKAVNPEHYNERPEYVCAYYAYWSGLPMNGRFETYIRPGHGFAAVETHGGQTVIVHAVPTPHPRFDAERCLRDTLSALTGDRQAAGAARHQQLAATVACKAAIKAGDPLAPEEMRALFIALRDCKLPAHDVHGRSTIVQLSWDELDRRFGRR